MQITEKEAREAGKLYKAHIRLIRYKARIKALQKKVKKCQELRASIIALNEQLSHTHRTLEHLNSKYRIMHHNYEADLKTLQAYRIDAARRRGQTDRSQTTAEEEQLVNDWYGK